MRKELIVYQEPKSPISEVFRTLRTNIQFMNANGKLKTILVTSTLPEEGKSWVSSNLAVTFAQAEKKVIIIDADMRKGRQYSIFGVSPRPGLSNYLSGINSNEDGENSEDITNYIQQTQVENLYLIPAGNIPPNPSELLITPKMVNLLEELKEMFDIVIIDGTPSQLVTDSLILTRLADSTLIVTASKQTKKEDLKRIIGNIQNVGGKIAGVIVNKMQVSTKKYEDSYYYGSTSTSKTKTSSSYNKNTQTFNKISSAMMGQRNTQNITNKNRNKPSEDVTKTLKKDIKIENKDSISIEDKTADILKQINDYLDKEKN